jgi:hypothetical protein
MEDLRRIRKDLICGNERAYLYFGEITKGIGYLVQNGPITCTVFSHLTARRADLIVEHPDGCTRQFLLR